MCGRFALTLPHEAMADLFQADVSGLPDIPPQYNICPTQQIVTILTVGDERVAETMRWGFLPRWYKAMNDGPLLINARSETIAEKPAFRDACRKRRCLIPATGFYEWTKNEKGGRDPWYILPNDGGTLAFAGVWQEWSVEGQPRVVSVAIVTCGANEPMSAIHSRMPVIISPDDFALWLGEDGHGAAALMRPADEDLLRFYRVSPEVNGARHNSPEFIEPLAAN